MANEHERGEDGGFPEWLMHAPWAVGVPALALGVAGLAGRGPRLLRDHKAASGALVAVATLGLARWQLARWFTEQPDYEREGVSCGLELRRYPSRVIAETTIGDDDFERALGEGFRRLAGYIFGGNSRTQKLPMTAPVNAASAGPEKLAMTAPVTSAEGDGGFTVAFTLPKGRELSSFPRPDDGRVRLRAQEAQRVAVLRSGGTYSTRRRAELEAELLRRAGEAGLRPLGPPAFAGYDSPATLPFLRRLELWLPVA